MQDENHFPGEVQAGRARDAEERVSRTSSVPNQDLRSGQLRLLVRRSEHLPTRGLALDGETIASCVIGAAIPLLPTCLVMRRRAGPGITYGADAIQMILDGRRFAGIILLLVECSIGGLQSQAVLSERMGCGQKKSQRCNAGSEGCARK